MHTRGKHGPQGRAMADHWRAVLAALVRYANTDAEPEADGAFLAHRLELAAAIVRWAHGLPLEAVVTFAHGPHRGARRSCWGRLVLSQRWDRVTRAGLVLADALADEGPARVGRVRVAAFRLRAVAMRWAIAASRAGAFRFEAEATRVPSQVVNGRREVAA